MPKTQIRTVQFLLERPYPPSMLKRPEFSEPFPIWVYWPPLKNCDHLCTDCRTVYRVANPDEIAEILPAKYKLAVNERGCVCSCMGKLIE
jgi:hypothetical protein